MGRQEGHGLSLGSIAGGETNATGSARSAARLSYKLTFVYAVLGALWILASDLALSALVLNNSVLFDHAQTFKGWLFVLVTAVSLHFILRDYSRRMAEKSAELFELERSFRDHADAASDWLWETDADDRFTLISERFGELTGLDPAAYYGRRRDEFFADDFSPQLHREHERILAAREPIRDFVYRLQSEDVANRHVRVSGKPFFAADGTFLGYRGVGRDVSAEVNAAAQRDLLAALVEASPDLVGTASLDGQLRYINQSGRTLLGLDSSEDLSERFASDFHPPDTLAELRDHAIPAAIANGAWSGHANLLTRAGDAVPVSMVVIAHKDEQGRVTFLSTVARDMTQQLDAEKRLRMAHKMEALGQLTGSVAHDFNNLLVVTLGSAEVLTEHLEGDDYGRELAELIVKAADQGAELVHRLLAFSRQQTLKPSAVEMKALTESLQHLLHRILGEQITLSCAVADDVPTVFCDRSELETCIVNLAVNARDAMPNGGAFTLEAVDVVVDAELAKTQPGLAPGSYVMLIVSDTGVGISSATKERIFEPFFTTKDEGKGNGLGLPMVYGFVKQSGGHVTVYSEVGRGTTFRLYLPHSADGAHAPAAVESPASVIQGGDERVLVVEDEELVRSYVTDQLERLGYHVVAVEDGPAAVDCLANGDRVDLLLTDMVMPGGLTGAEVASEARRMRPGIKVLYTTGYARGAQGATSELGVAASVLAKPYRRQDLALMVRQALDA